VLPAVGAVAAAGALGWWAWERRHRRTRAMPGGLCADVTLPHEREFELYHNALSLCSKKVRVCLAELGIPYASRHVDLIETGSYENIGRRFLAVNPAGLLPVLVHRGHPVYESHEQIRYAAAHAPAGAPPLVPSDPVLAAEMQRWVERTSLIGDDPTVASRESAGGAVPGLTVPLFAAMIEDIPARRIVEGLLFHRLKTRPLAFLALKGRGLRGLARLRPAVRMLQRSIRDMGEHLDVLEVTLRTRGGPWILGGGLSLADVSWVPILERLVEADAMHLFLGDGQRPAVQAYWDRLRARPSYAAAVGAHAHPAVARGTVRIREAKAADPALRRALETAARSDRRGAAHAA
jgi:glutathione S-transferase